MESNGNTMNTDELLLIGYIAGAFGIRGQVKMKAVTDQPEHLQRQVRTIYLGTSPRRPGQPVAAPRPYRLMRVATHKPGLLLLTLQGVNTRDDADTLRHHEVYMHQKDAAPLEQDEYYLHDLYDLRVETTDGADIGTVYDILETGVNEVLIVKRDGQPDALIPIIHDIVKELDIAGGRIVIQPVEGLL